MKSTRVVNVRYELYDVYIGRQSPRHGLQRSKWANPFRLANPGIATYEQRMECIDKYRTYLNEHPELLAQVAELRGKTLGCWCAPSPCHGDVLKELADESYEEIVQLMELSRRECERRGPMGD